MTKMYLQNHCQCNTVAYGSHTNHSRYFLIHLSPYTHYHVLKFDNILPTSNQAMVQNFICAKVMTVKE